MHKQIIKKAYNAEKKDRLLKQPLFYSEVSKEKYLNTLTQMKFIMKEK